MPVNREPQAQPWVAEPNKWAASTRRVSGIPAAAPKLRDRTPTDLALTTNPIQPERERQP
jgi:hypothetical protein